MGQRQSKSVRTFTAHATEQFMRFTSLMVEDVGEQPRREVLEQYVCFAAAVWNAVVVLEDSGEDHVLIELIREVRKLPDPQRDKYATLLGKLALAKARDFRGQLWVYRHAHVICGKDGELRVRAEMLPVDQWNGEPLRMGLPD